MFGTKEYIGITIQDDTLRVARLRVKGGTIKLVKLDRFSLVEKIAVSSSSEGAKAGSESQGEEEAESIFGLEESEQEEEELDFEELEAEAEVEEEDLSLDMVEETEEAQSNELLLYNILTGIENEKISLGLNVPGGSTIYQIIRDTDFNEVKKKDLIKDLEDKLQSIYGTPKSSDNYSYEIREDGSLLLASIEEEPVTLKLLNKARELYSGKLDIQSIIPDEVALVGLVRANYDMDADEITGIVQFGKEQCRLVFMKGEEIWLVSPIINEGTDSKSFLNTVFSKILFQLDTGEVPNLDRILLANNHLGNEPVEFFEENFPDIHVENLALTEDLFETENIDPASIPAFTTTIGTALAASGELDEYFPELTFIPQYVLDRQKIFQLQWHGMLILFLIFLTPITFNYFYIQNARQIDSLNSELSQMNSQIKGLEPLVKKTNELSSDIATLREKLTLLDTLSQGSREWSAKLNILNNGIQKIGNTWITAFSEQSKGGVFLRGYTLYRNRIPRVVNIFEEATLMNVNIEQMREQEVFSFAIQVSKFAASDSLYSPPTPEEVENLIKN